MSILIVCGISYHNRPIDQREILAMPRQCLIPAMQMLKAQDGIKECAILSTCNRNEIYAVASCAESGLRASQQFFQAAASVHGRTIKPNLKLLQDDAALQLFRVAGGLDSMVIGEGQILGQVKEALEMAQKAGSAGPILHKLFTLAIKCGKRIRTETGMSQRAVSVASAAVELARSHYGSLRQRNALVVGAGRMGTLCAKHLGNKNCGANVTVANRTDLSQLIVKADVIFVATGASEYIIDRQHIQECSQPKYFFDLSVPRNINPAIDRIANVSLFSIDDLQSIVQRNLEERQRVAADAEPVVFEALHEYQQWLIAHSASSTITTFRNSIHESRRKFIAAARSPSSMSDEQHIENVTTRIVNRLIHGATVNLRKGYNGDSLADLFNLT
jgi:glutamyl-tRNA reductase